MKIWNPGSKPGRRQFFRELVENPVKKPNLASIGILAAADNIPGLLFLSAAAGIVQFADFARMGIQPR
jgi:hypothetical protein